MQKLSGERVALPFRPIAMVKGFGGFERHLTRLLALLRVGFNLGLCVGGTVGPAERSGTMPTTWREDLDDNPDDVASRARRVAAPRPRAGVVVDEGAG